MTDWDARIDEYGPMVYRISWRILGNAADVDDNAQEVFLDAYRLGQRQRVRSWPGLLRRLATLGALARLRKRRAAVPLDPEQPADKHETPDEIAIARELQARLRSAVSELPAREGAVFSLRYFEGLDLAAVAATLQIQYGAAATALSRARAKIEADLGAVAMETT